MSDPALPPAPAAPPVAPGPPAYYAPQPPKGLSIASIILGLASVVLCVQGWGLFPGIAAVITGHLAAKRQPYARGLWLTGLITGYVGLVVSLAWAVYIAVIVVLFFGDSGNFSG